MTKLSENLKKFRKEKSISQYKLSEDLNIKRSAYGNYETGMSYPEYDVLEKIANYFNVEANVLLGKEKDFDKNINIEETAKEVRADIKRYFYRKYRIIPSEDIINKIVKNI